MLSMNVVKAVNQEKFPVKQNRAIKATHEGWNVSVLTFPLIIWSTVINSYSLQNSSQFSLRQIFKFLPSTVTPVIDFLNQNFCSAQAFRFWAFCMFSSTLLIGINKSRLYERMTRVNSTTKHPIAEFSKSVSCSSHGRNSTRQPMEVLGGGGLKRIVCQFVDWMFSKWSVSSSSFWFTFSLKRETVSRMKRWATCCASSGSILPAKSLS